MSEKTMLEKIDELKELESMLDELKGYIEDIKDELKTVLLERKIEELEVGTHVIRYTTVLSNRFDTTNFKRVMPDVYKAYTKQITSRRFTIS